MWCTIADFVSGFFTPLELLLLHQLGSKRPNVVAYKRRSIRQPDSDTLPLPRWLEIHDLEDLKNHLVSIVVAVLFLREAVARAGDLDLLKLGAAPAIMIGAFTLYLAMKVVRKE